jgi:hypothetical protein
MAGSTTRDAVDWFVIVVETVSSVMSLVAVVLSVLALLLVQRDRRVAYDSKVLERIVDLLGKIEEDLVASLKSGKDRGLLDIRASPGVDTFAFRLNTLSSQLISHKRYALIFAYKEYVNLAMATDDEAMPLLHIPFQNHPIKYVFRKVARESFDGLARPLAPGLQEASGLWLNEERWQRALLAEQDLERLRLVRGFIRQLMLGDLGVSTRRILVRSRYNR